MNKKIPTAIAISIVLITAILAGGFICWRHLSFQEELSNQPNIFIPKETTQNKAVYKKEDPPRFEDFYVSEVFQGEPVAPDFSTNPDAQSFITRITEGVKEGPNFAGHYTVIKWGCGTSCGVGAIVDAKTGAIYWLPTYELGLDFRIDSNLLIVNPAAEIKELFGDYEVPSWAYTTYYLWQDNQLIELFDTRTANWQTYKNEEYGFEIKYPGDYFQGINTQSEDINALYYGKETILLQSKNFDAISNKYLTNLSIIYTNLDFDSFKNKAKDSEEYGETPLEFISTTIDNKPAYSFREGGVQMEEVYVFTEILIPIENGSIIIALNKVGSDFTNDEITIFNQMLLTFKFID